MRKLLITGGAGYIGSGLLDVLDQDAMGFDEVLIYDNLSRKNFQSFFIKRQNPNRFRLIQGDLLDSRKLERALNGVDTVVHLAARVTTPYADHEAHQFEQVNHWGTAELVNAVERSEVKKMVYMSSMSVYGRGEDEVFTEGHLCDPHSFYGISKLRGEEHVLRLEDKLEIVVFRAANVFGFHPAMRMDSVINKFMFQAQHKQVLKVSGEGLQVRPFIHLSRTVEALKAAISGKLTAGVFNLTDANWALVEVLELIQGLYPEVEMIYQNRHMPYISAVAEVPGKVHEIIGNPEVNLNELLTEFKMSFGY